MYLSTQAKRRLRNLEPIHKEILLGIRQAKPPAFPPLLPLSFPFKPSVCEPSNINRDYFELQIRQSYSGRIKEEKRAAEN